MSGTPPPVEVGAAVEAKDSPDARTTSRRRGRWIPTLTATVAALLLAASFGAAPPAERPNSVPPVSGPAAERDAPLAGMAGGLTALVLLLAGAAFLLVRAGWRRKAEARRIAEQRTANRVLRVLETATDGFLVHDESGRILEVNEALTRVSGYSAAELLSSRLHDLEVATDEEVSRRIRSLLAAPGVRYLSRWRRRDGRRIDLEVSASAQREEGEARICAFVRDVTDDLTIRRRLEQASRLYAFLHHAGEALFSATSPDQACAEVCRIAVADVGFALVRAERVDPGSGEVRPVSVAGPASDDLINLTVTTDPSLPTGLGPSGRAILEAEPVIVNELATDPATAPGHSLARRHGLGSCASLPILQEGRVIGALTFYSLEAGYFESEMVRLLGEIARTLGLTLQRFAAEARQRIEAELRQTEQPGEEANRARSSFLARMSHEIRTPMNGVLGMAEVLAASPLAPRDAEAVRTIQASAASLLGLIDEILDFSKIEAGRLEIEMVATEVSAVVEAVCDALAPVAAARQVDLACFVAPELPRLLVTDAARLRQILYNLVANGVKFGAGSETRRGRVELRMEAVPGETGRIRFRVIDDGIGMSPETQASLFESFRQGESSTTRRFGGTGLGLAICRRLTDLLGGTISVVSAAGAGSTFTVTLPMAAAASQPPRTLPDLTGVVCVLAPDGFASGEGEDLAAHLRFAGADLRAAPTNAEARRLAEALPAPVVLIERIRAADGEGGPMCAQDGIRHLRIADGPRRGTRVVAPDCVILDRPVLRQASLVRAVAVAAGRASPESFQEEPEGPLVAARAPRPDVEEAARAGRLVLVAEDDEINRRVILRQLELLGYTAETAADGRQALDLWRTGRHALLLTDLHMPGMDGYTLAATIRAEEGGAGGRRRPLVALTANAVRGEENRARESGLDEFLTKPVHVRQLKRVLDRYLAEASADGPAPAAPRGETAGAPALQVEVLQSYFGSDPVDAREFLEDFRASVVERSAAMRAAAAAGRVQDVAHQAHALKSSARWVGALALGDLCAELESAARSGNTGEIARLLPGLDARVAAVRAEVERLLET